VNDRVINYGGGGEEKGKKTANLIYTDKDEPPSRVNIS
jgi:hypothetical protein